MRLGFPERGRQTLFVFALIVVGTALLGAWLNSRGVVGAPTSQGIEGSGAGYFSAWFFLHIAAAMVVAFQQRKHFELFLESGGKPGNPLLAIALALVGGVMVQQAVVRMAVRLFAASG